MDTNGNLEYIEGLPQNRLPGAMLPEFHEASDDALVQSIPQGQHDSAVAKVHRVPHITLPSFVFSNTNGDAGLNQPIPYGRANSVRVDNYTTQWCKVGGVHIGPSTYGWVIALDRAVTNARLGWEAPPGITQPATTSGTLVYTFWYEERFPAQAGISFGGAAVSAPTTGTETNVAGSATSVTILAANSSRKAASIYNDSSAILYLLLGVGPASTTVFTVEMASNTLYEVLANYTGIITGIWASATGSARVTELT